jgi:hypothetical protein
MDAPLKIPLKPWGAKGVRFDVLVNTAPAAALTAAAAAAVT